jgi:DNA-binding NarL/FixJ family response regulator
MLATTATRSGGDFTLLNDRPGEAMAATGILDGVREFQPPMQTQPVHVPAGQTAARLADAGDRVWANPAHLTAREAEVLRLVATGLGNAAIADRLFISLSTVKVHVANIFAKLDVTNRAAATHFAVDHGLT